MPGTINTQDEGTKWREMAAFGLLLFSIPMMITGAAIAWGVGGAVFVTGGLMCAAGVALGMIRQ